MTLFFSDRVATRTRAQGASGVGRVQVQKILVVAKYDSCNKIQCSGYLVDLFAGHAGGQQTGGLAHPSPFLTFLGTMKNVRARALPLFSNGPHSKHKNVSKMLQSF
jgi:hypothetical protein